MCFQNTLLAAHGHSVLNHYIHIFFGKTRRRPQPTKNKTNLSKQCWTSALFNSSVYMTVLCSVVTFCFPQCISIRSIFYMWLLSCTLFRETLYKLGGMHVFSCCICIDLNLQITLSMVILEVSEMKGRKQIEWVLRTWWLGVYLNLRGRKLQFWENPTIIAS